MSSARDRQRLAQAWMKKAGTYKGKLDGLWGSMSEKAYIALTPVPASSSIRPPSADYYSVTKVFGKAGDENNLVRFTFPYPVHLAWGDKKALKTHRCHKLIKKPLISALKEIYGTYGMAWIKKHGLDSYGGIYNFRKTRAGNSTSKHSWGIAIDLNPNENGNRVKWKQGKQGTKGYATMPLGAIKIFEKHGFKSAARAWGRDAMHFQYTK